MPRILFVVVIAFAGWMAFMAWTAVEDMRGKVGQRLDCVTAEAYEAGSGGKACRKQGRQVGLSRISGLRKRPR